MNHVILVGRLATDPIVEETSTGKKRTCVNLAIPRGYRNANGVYETDFIRIVLWNGMASNTKEYCHQGDMIGIKGRIQNRSYEIEPENKEEKPITKYITEVIAEKVSFISSKNSISEDDDSDIIESNIINCY